MLSNVHHLIICSLALAVAISVQQCSNFTSTDCVDPNGFDSCFQKASDTASSCLKVTAANDVAPLACTCALYLAEINCALSSYWNEIRAFGPWMETQLVASTASQK